MHHLTSENFDQNAREALRDPVLHGALRNLADNFVERRRIAMSSVDDWEGLRTRARAIKDETLAHLDEYLLQFVENAEKGGVKFHWARDGAEACRIVLSRRDDAAAVPRCAAQPDRRHFAQRSRNIFSGRFP